METVTEEVLELYTPHDGQWHLHNSTARFRMATCGRRWGKTYACINEIAQYAWENPDCMTWWVAPTYKQAKIAFRILTREFRHAMEKSLKSEMLIRWKSGGITEFKSTDNYDSLRGEGVSFMVIDEAALIPAEAWHEVLRPTLSDTRGRAIIVSTPKGRNWFYHLWMRGKDPAFSDYASFRFPTSSNPYIDEEEVEEAKSTLPADAFHQEYEAEFLEESAGVFRNFRSCINGKLESPKPGHAYVIGFDVAKHTDFSVLTCFDLQEKRVVAFDRFNQIDYRVQLERVEQMVESYNNASVLMDSTGVGDPILEQLEERHIEVEGFKFHNQSKQQLIENLAVMLEKKQICFPDIPVLINELEMFQYEMTRSGSIRYSAPDGMHDDCVISLALGAWAMKHHTPLQLFI